ncbi:hypothetical protein GCM10010232_18100 [Streptomyces amakusaensis]
MLAGEREFRAALDSAARIPHESYEDPGGHFVRRWALERDIDGGVARLRKA